MERDRKVKKGVVSVTAVKGIMNRINLYIFPQLYGSSADERIATQRCSTGEILPVQQIIPRIINILGNRLKLSAAFTYLCRPKKVLSVELIDWESPGSA